MTGSPSWRRRHRIVWRYTTEGVVVLPVGGGEPVSLAGAALAVWQSLRTPGTVEEVAGRLAPGAGASRDEVRDGVSRAIQALASQSLVEEDRRA